MLNFTLIITVVIAPGNSQALFPGEKLGLAYSKYGMQGPAGGSRPASNPSRQNFVVQNMHGKVGSFSQLREIVTEVISAFLGDLIDGGVEIVSHSHTFTTAPGCE
jgi:hypothetical protein